MFFEGFPKDHELLEFFGGEPTTSDGDDVPWVYQQLEFSSRFGADQVDCIFDNPHIEIRWRREHEELLIVGVDNVRRLVIQADSGGRVLVAASSNSTLRLQLEPKIHVAICDNPQ